MVFECGEPLSCSNKCLSYIITRAILANPLKMHLSEAQSTSVSHLYYWLQRMTPCSLAITGDDFHGLWGVLRSSVDVQTIKRIASTALMKSRSIFADYVGIVRNQVYRDHFELILKKQNRIAIANITLQKRTIDESDNKFLKVFYSGSALLVCYPAIYWRLGWQASR